MSVIDYDNYYCSQKFTWLSVDVEKRLTNSCCAAAPHKIDLEWLKNNSGQLFNTELLQAERQQMLDNLPVAGCENSCWQPEKNGLTSRRIWSKSNLKTHTDVKKTSPTTLNINLGSNCNLTCSYCCKQYSSAWRQDILNHGPYLAQPRYTLTNQDRVLLKISQPDHSKTSATQLIIDEMLNFDLLKNVIITGGEPFLYNGLIDLIQRFKNVPEIIIYTGLGVNSTRFENQLKKLNQRDNILVAVSGENCGQKYEFNRYNNTWKNFLKNLDILKNQELKVKFSSVISNLTVFGLSEFIDKFSDDNMYNWSTDPDFLSVNVLDDASKHQLIEHFKNTDYVIRDQLITALEAPCTDEQRKNFASYLFEFAKRRQLNLDIFPNTMLDWLKM